MEKIKVIIRADSTIISSDAAFLTYYFLNKSFVNCEFLILAKLPKIIYFWAKSAMVPVKYVDEFPKIEIEENQDFIICNSGNLLLRPDLIEKNNINDNINKIYLSLKNNNNTYKQVSTTDLSSESITPFVNINSWMLNLYSESRLNILSQGWNNLRFKTDERTSNQTLFLKMIPSSISLYQNFIRRFS
jgi:hypothetical protein